LEKNNEIVENLNSLSNELKIKQFDFSIKFNEIERKLANLEDDITETETEQLIN